MSRGFSLASLILAFFQIAGAVAAVYLGLRVAEVQADWVPYAVSGGGGFLGGWFAARASRGQTILEPAIGAVLVTALFFGTIWASPLGSWIWSAARDQSILAVAKSAGPVLGGALVGAFLSEKALGDATTSTIPWVLYFLLATFGGCLTAVLGAGLAGILDERALEHRDLVFLSLVGGGCLLSGLAGGGTSRRRPIGASFLGGAIGTAAFAFLAHQAGQSIQAPAGMEAVVTQGPWAEIALFGGAGGFVTTIGATLGWGIFGGQS
jgi:hypothetical protein